MNVNEWGIQFAFSTAFNMSSFTTLQIEFVKPDQTQLIVNATCPNFNLSTTLGLFLANMYASYVFQPGDVNQAGLWAARVLYTDATPQHLISNVASFTVGN